MTVPETSVERRDHESTDTSATLVQTVSSFGYSAAGTALSPARRGEAALDHRRGRLLGLVGLLLPLILLAAWQLISASGAVPAYRLPSPAAVWTAGIDLWNDGTLGPYVAISLQRVLLGFVFGAVVGIVVGSVVGLSRWAGRLVAPTIGGFRAVPSLAWVPLLILYLGINEDSKVLLITIGAFFPIYTTVAGALRHVDPQLVELGRAYGFTRVRLLSTVQLPAVVPTVISGLRLALAQSWLFLVAAELISSSMGLGFLLSESQNNGRIDRLFLAIILLALLGKATDAVVGILERVLLRRWT
jgi:sulfonate transport system permease protein